MKNQITDCLTRAPSWFKSDPDTPEVQVELPLGLEDMVTINHVPICPLEVLPQIEMFLAKPIKVWICDSEK